MKEGPVFDIRMMVGAYPLYRERLPPQVDAVGIRRRTYSSRGHRHEISIQRLRYDSDVSPPSLDNDKNDKIYVFSRRKTHHGKVYFLDDGSLPRQKNDGAPPYLVSKYCVCMCVCACVRVCVFFSSHLFRASPVYILRYKWAHQPESVQA